MNWTTTDGGKGETRCIGCKKRITCKPSIICPLAHKTFYQRMLLKNAEYRIKSHYIHQKRYAWNIKRKAIAMLGGRCVKCGLTDIRLLTVNHKNGGGNKERQLYRSQHLFREIAFGRRKIDDLDLRCFNCNVLYEYEVGRLHVIE
jgi:hypothetical protein